MWIAYDIPERYLNFSFDIWQVPTGDRQSTYSHWLRKSALEIKAYNYLGAVSDDLEPQSGRWEKVSTWFTKEEDLWLEREGFAFNREEGFAFDRGEYYNKYLSIGTIDLNYKDDTHYLAYWLLG